MPAPGMPSSIRALTASNRRFNCSWFARSEASTASSRAPTATCAERAFPREACFTCHCTLGRVLFSKRYA